MLAILQLLFLMGFTFLLQTICMYLKAYIYSYNAVFSIWDGYVLSVSMIKIYPFNVVICNTLTAICNYIKVPLRYFQIYHPTLKSLKTLTMSDFNQCINIYVKLCMYNRSTCSYTYLTYMYMKQFI